MDDTTFWILVIVSLAAIGYLSLPVKRNKTNKGKAKGFGLLNTEEIVSDKKKAGFFDPLNHRNFGTFGCRGEWWKNRRPMRRIDPRFRHGNEEA